MVLHAGRSEGGRRKGIPSVSFFAHALQSQPDDAATVVCELNFEKLPLQTLPRLRVLSESSHTGVTLTPNRDPCGLVDKCYKRQPTFRDGQSRPLSLNSASPRAAAHPRSGTDIVAPSTETVL